MADVDGRVALPFQLQMPKNCKRNRKIVPIGTVGQLFALSVGPSVCRDIRENDMIWSLNQHDRVQKLQIWCSRAKRRSNGSRDSYVLRDTRDMVLIQDRLLLVLSCAQRDINSLTLQLSAVEQRSFWTQTTKFGVTCRSRATWRTWPVGCLG